MDDIYLVNTTSVSFINDCYGLELVVDVSQEAYNRADYLSVQLSNNGGLKSFYRLSSSGNIPGGGSYRLYPCPQSGASSASTLAYSVGLDNYELFHDTVSVTGSCSDVPALSCDNLVYVGTSAPISAFTPSPTSSVPATSTHSAFSTSSSLAPSPVFPTPTPSPYPHVRTKSTKVAPAAIAGGVIGCLAGLALLVVIILLLRRRNRHKREASDFDQTSDLASSVSKLDTTSDGGAKWDVRPTFTPQRDMDSNLSFEEKKGTPPKATLSNASYPNATTLLAPARRPKEPGSPPELATAARSQRAAASSKRILPPSERPSRVAVRESKASKRSSISPEARIDDQRNPISSPSSPAASVENPLFSPVPSHRGSKQI